MRHDCNLLKLRRKIPSPNKKEKKKEKEEERRKYYDDRDDWYNYDEGW